jgi:hypothetical protein
MSAHRFSAKLLRLANGVISVTDFNFLEAYA